MCYYSFTDSNKTLSRKETPMFAVLAVPAVPADLSVDLGDFAATTARFAAVTDAGREFLAAQFGRGAISVDVRKSEAPAFAAFAKQCGVIAR
jgi:hypothetical protein